MTPSEIDQLLRPLTIKDLRVQTRARGLSPAGGIDTLKDRLKEHMISTGDFALKNEDGTDLTVVTVTAGVSTSEQVAGKSQNNYVRPAGQNVGNMLTDRPSSRVLAAPGGGSQITFGDYQDPHVAKFNAAAAAANANNNYTRPAGQNVGNFLTEKPSSRVLAAPGGGSQIIFG